MALAVVALYWPTKDFAFLNFDDDLYVTKNIEIQRGWSAGILGRAASVTLVGNWQPLTFLSHALDVQLFGLDAGRHHLMNVLLHAVNAVLLIVLVRRFGAGLGAAFFAAALFALHPLRVESVAWIAERKDVLCTLFFLLALLSYTRFARTKAVWDYACVAGAACLGLLSKPMLVTLPAVLLLLDAWPLGRGRAASTGEAVRVWARLVREKLPLFALVAVFCIITLRTQGQADAVRDLDVLPFVVRAQTAAVAYMAYLGKLFWPVGLSPFYKHPMGWPPALVAACVVGLLALSVLAVRLRRGRPWWTVGWLWYLGTALPVIGLIQVGDQWMADRYTYIPMIGLAIAFAFEGQWLARHGPFVTWILRGLAAAVLLALSLATARQLPVWKDTGTLSRQAIAGDGGHWAMRTNHAIHLAEQGRGVEALSEFEAIYREYPGDPETLNNLGYSLFSAGKAARAVPFFNKAVEIKPDYHRARVNLGRARLATGNPREAVSEFERVVAANPSDPAAYGYAALIYAADPEIGDPEKALAYARTAIDRSSAPNFLALEVISMAHAHAGRRDEALVALEKARQTAADCGQHALATKFEEKARTLHEGK